MSGFMACLSWSLNFAKVRRNRCAKAHNGLNKMLCNAKRSFYRTPNEMFGKIGRFASEKVTLQLIHSKCMPALL